MTTILRLIKFLFVLCVFGSGVAARHYAPKVADSAAEGWLSARARKNRDAVKHDGRVAKDLNGETPMNMNNSFGKPKPEPVASESRLSSPAPRPVFGSGLSSDAAKSLPGSRPAFGSGLSGSAATPMKPEDENRSPFGGSRLGK